ncbi:MAG: hypothetical protein IJI24_06955 [Lachnospiraceae bacterium]|nr:hypothetical protein [Lachnospiraceae bacterium]
MILEKELALYSLQNVAGKGLMPDEKLVKYADEYYGERTVGYNRQYAAFGADQRIDMLVRIWRNDAARIGHYAILEDGNQYRIDNVQHLKDGDGLEVTDLTLRRLEDNYNVKAE